MRTGTGTEGSIRVLATPPLYRSGLRRIAESVGFDVTDADPSPTVLRGAHPPAPDAGIDIAVEQGRVLITVVEAPSRETWRLVGDLLGRLLESGRRSLRSE